MRPTATLPLVLLACAPLVGCLATRTDLTSTSGRIAGWSGLAPTPSVAVGSVPAGPTTTGLTDPVPQGSSPVCYVLAPRLPRASTQTAEPGIVWVEAVCEGQVDPVLALSVQRALTRLGYLPGDEDGRYGPRTGAAVERFKRDRLIYGDGLTAETLSALGVVWQRPPALTRESR